MILTMEPDKKILYPHIPVLSREVVAQFDFPSSHDALPGSSGGHARVVVDGTLGLGGHSAALLERYLDLSVLGVEWDADALVAARERLSPFGDRFRAVQGSYADLPSILEREGIGPVSGLILDLGVSSLQLDNPARGFSFSKRGPLDMRMSRSLPLTAWDLINRWDESELARIFREYGEELQARRVARTLKASLERGQLTNDASAVAQCIRSAFPAGRGRIDPATRTFQALRMAVNHELDNVDAVLDALPSILKSGGRAVILSFHSLEDRKVKDAFHQAAKGCICPPQIPQCVCGKEPWATLPVRKAIQASETEKQANPRSRSVRMRVLEKR